MLGTRASKHFEEMGQRARRDGRGRGVGVDGHWNHRCVYVLQSTPVVLLVLRPIGFRLDVHVVL